MHASCSTIAYGCCPGSHKHPFYGLQSFFTDLKSLANVTGLNSGIYSALTASFVLAGLTYIGLPSQTLTAIFGTSAEKGLEDIFLWQLIGTAVSMAVAPVAFTQQVRQVANLSTPQVRQVADCDTHVRRACMFSVWAAGLYSSTPHLLELLIRRIIQSCPS